MTERPPQPPGARRGRPARAPNVLPDRITGPLTPDQIRALGTDDPWGSDEEFDKFLADLAETRGQD